LLWQSYNVAVYAMNCELFQIVTNCRVIDAYVMQRRPLTYVTFPAVLPVLIHASVIGREPGLTP
jgi:hypothetical protein